MTSTSESTRNKQSKLESKSDLNVKMKSNSKENKSATRQPNLDIQPFATFNDLRYSNWSVWTTKSWRDIQPEWPESKKKVASLSVRDAVALWFDVNGDCNAFYTKWKNVSFIFVSG